LRVKVQTLIVQEPIRRMTNNLGRLNYIFSIYLKYENKSKIIAEAQEKNSPPTLGLRKTIAVIRPALIEIKFTKAAVTFSKNQL
jgi:hypothetical protein